MNQDPIRDDAQRAGRERRLGEVPVCFICGESDPDVLTLQWHHTAGRNNEPRLQVRLCLNCHARQTAAHRQEGIELEAPEQLTLDRLPDILAGNGRYLVMFGELLIELAHRLKLFITGLDASCPAWRELPEAHLD